MKIFLERFFFFLLVSYSNTNATRKTEDFSRRKFSLFLVQTLRRKSVHFLTQNFSYMWLWKAKKDCKLSPWTCGKVNRIFLQLNTQKLSYRALDLAHSLWFSQRNTCHTRTPRICNFSTRSESVYIRSKPRYNTAFCAFSSDSSNMKMCQERYVQASSRSKVRALARSMRRAKFLMTRMHACSKEV